MANLDALAQSARGQAGDSIFIPDQVTIAGSELTAFMEYCGSEIGREFGEYADFERFSIAEFRSFWGLFLRWSEIQYEGEPDPVCADYDCEVATFFPNVRLGYTDSLLREAKDSGDHAALTACHGDGRRERFTRGELRNRVARVAGALAEMGVQPGDRVVAIARNGAEAVIAALATAGLGATFSSCAPDMGSFAILARFAQLDPILLMGHLRAEEWDVGTPVATRLAEVAGGLPSLRTIVVFDDGPGLEDMAGKPVRRFSDMISRAVPDRHGSGQRWPFNQPLFILFSSGTTGQPKCIVHGAGGTLLEHVKEHRLHCNLRRGDKLFFQTSCAWMMWNWQLSALASEVELVLYDGPVAGPETLWDIVSTERVTVFGTSPAYLQMCEDREFAPNRHCDLDALRAVLSTGSILYDRQYDWVSKHVKSRLPLQSISGGTDIVGCFVLGNPNLPVRRGEAQCRSLGLDVRAISPGDAHDAVGELVCANAFPSRPVGFYADHDRSRFHAAYFSQNPGVWTHGDLIEFTPQGGARLHGRSDGVLNIRGIRIGPAEIYRILQDIPEIAEAMAVEQPAEDEPGAARLVLLVVLRGDAILDSTLAARIRSELTRRGSAAHVPARIAQMEELPVTHSGKRSETAARDALAGRPARNRNALRNPDCLDAIAQHPALRRPEFRGTIEQSGASFAPPVEAAQPLWRRLRRIAAWPRPDDLRCRAGSRRTRPTEAREVLEPRDALERDLRRIFEAMLEFSPISRRDNFFELGGDSLRAVRLLTEVRRQFHQRLSLSAIWRAPTVEGLAELIRKESAGTVAPSDNPELAVSPASPALQSISAMAGTEASRLTPQVRPACANDIGRLCAFLHREFNDRISVDEWRRIFDYEWLVGKPNLGFVLTTGDEVVGFLGTIYVRRLINGKTALICNHTTWYIRPEFRGWGLALLEAALSDAEVTYTNFTPSPVAAQIYNQIGFKPLESHKLLFLPLVNAWTLRLPAPRIIDDPAELRSLLDEERLRIFEHHAPHKCLQLLVLDGDRRAHIVLRHRRWHGIALMELLHCSDPDLLVRHFERVKFSLLRRQGALALIADRRLIPRCPHGSISFRQQKFFYSSRFNADELDNLYSELVVLPV